MLYQLSYAHRRAIAVSLGQISTRVKLERDQAVRLFDPRGSSEAQRETLENAVS